MAKVDSLIKTNIGSLSKSELEKLVLKAAGLNKQFHDFLLVNYFDKEHGEKVLFDEARSDLQVLYRKGYKGFSYELQMANMLAACNKRIVEFSKVCKNKSLEMDLILEVLDIPFSGSSNIFTTCFTKLNYQVYLLLKKAVSLLKTKLHEDYRVEYEEIINKHLEFMHKNSSHLDYVYAMPKSV